MTITFDGNEMTGGTIHGEEITEMTLHGEVVFSAGPGTPPDESNLEMWYEPRLLEGYSTGENVYTLRDEQGNHDLTASSGYRAAYDSSGINGEAGLYFDDDVYVSGQFSSAIDQPVTIYAVIDADDTQNENYPFATRDRTVSSGYLHGRTLNGNWMVSAGDYDNPLNSIPSGPTIVGGRFWESGGSFNYVYGNTENVDIGDGNMGEFNIGAIGEGSGHFPGWIGTVLVYNSAHTTSDMHYIGEWLADGYNI